jgi:hypothetical protein
VPTIQRSLVNCSPIPGKRFPITSSSDRAAIIADRTQEQSAEATRNAWLAVEACGGTLSADLPSLASPFDSAHPMIPEWNTTFWDISSP